MALPAKKENPGQMTRGAYYSLAEDPRPDKSRDSAARGLALPPCYNPVMALVSPADFAPRLPLLITGITGVAGYNALHYFRARYPARVIGIRPRQTRGLD